MEADSKTRALPMVTHLTFVAPKVPGNEKGEAYEMGYLAALYLFALNGHAEPGNQLTTTNSSVLTNDVAGAQVIGRPPPGPKPQSQNTWCSLNQFGGQDCGCKGPQRGKGGKCGELNTQICDCFDKYTNNIPKIPHVPVNP